MAQATPPLSPRSSPMGEITIQGRTYIWTLHREEGDQQHAITVQDAAAATSVVQAFADKHFSNIPREVTVDISSLHGVRNIVGVNDISPEVSKEFIELVKSVKDSAQTVLPMAPRLADRREEELAAVRGELAEAVRDRDAAIYAARTSEQRLGEFETAFPQLQAQLQAAREEATEAAQHIRNAEAAAAAANTRADNAERAYITARTQVDAAAQHARDADTARDAARADATQQSRYADAARTDLARLRGELDAARADAAAAARRADEAERARDTARDEAAAAARSAQEADAARDAARAERDAAVAERDAARASAVAAGQRAQTAEADRASAHNEIARLRTELAAANAEATRIAASLQANLTELQAQLEAAGNEVTVAVQRADGAERARNAAEDQAAAAAREAEVARDTARGDLARLEANLGAARAQIEAQVAQLREANAEVRAKHEQLTAAEMQVAELQDGLARAAAANAALGRQVNELVTNVSQLNEGQSRDPEFRRLIESALGRIRDFQERYQTEISHLRAEHERAQERLGTNAAELAELRRQLDLATEELTIQRGLAIRAGQAQRAAEEQRDALAAGFEVQIASLERELNRVRANSEDTLARAAATRDELDEANQLLAQMRTRIDELEAHVIHTNETAQADRDRMMSDHQMEQGSLRDRIANLERNIESVQALSSQAESERDALRVALDAAARQAQTDLEAARAESASLRRTVAQLETAKTAAEHLADSAEAERDAAKGALRDATQDHARLEAQLEEENRQLRDDLAAEIAQSISSLEASLEASTPRSAAAAAPEEPAAAAAGAEPPRRVETAHPALAPLSTITDPLSAAIDKLRSAATEGPPTTAKGHILKGLQGSGDTYEVNAPISKKCQTLEAALKNASQKGQPDTMRGTITKALNDVKKSLQVTVGRLLDTRKLDTRKEGGKLPKVSGLNMQHYAFFLSQLQRLSQEFGMVNLSAKTTQALIDECSKCVDGIIERLNEK